MRSIETKGITIANVEIPPITALRVSNIKDDFGTETTLSITRVNERDVYISLKNGDDVIKIGFTNPGNNKALFRIVGNNFTSMANSIANHNGSLLFRQLRTYHPQTGSKEASDMRIKVGDQGEISVQNIKGDPEENSLMGIETVRYGGIILSLTEPTSEKRLWIRFAGQEGGANFHCIPAILRLTAQQLACFKK
jgi:hypothetical protein